MPVFEKIAVEDSVQDTTMTMTMPTEMTAAEIADVACTCPVSDDWNHVVSDGPLLGQTSGFHRTLSPAQFLGHLSSCPRHATSNAPGFAHLKQQALFTQQQLLQRQQRQQDYEAQRRQRPHPFQFVRILPSRTCHLYSGSKFQGLQRSGSNSYSVTVEIKHVNLHESTLCGYLQIEGLTEDYPELTTFFDAEIIGPHYSFLTGKWDATIVTDEQHWSRFQPSPFTTCGIDETKYDFMDKDVIYMRWKEHFLVPDHRIEGIPGASFAGMYYVCYNKRTGQINGYYFHPTSEK
ncbi:hypothetical protein BGZ83_006574 [Gryganskiella cystojenkinii]|nr:hypothetical protein BGZ83_006574 [Gryganskiella cystojenkinii]